jgi:hypothetical protein
MAENTAVSTQGKQEMNTQLSYYTNQYIGLMERDFAEHGLVLNDYSKQCVMASMSAIYNLVTSSKAAMSNLNGSNLRQIIGQVSSLQLNANAVPRECYFQLRSKQDANGNWYKEVEMGIEGDGNDALLRNFGVDVKKVYPVWLVKEGDDFTYPKHKGIEVTPPEWEEKGLSQKVIRVVYPVEMKDGKVEYMIAERESVKGNLFAHVRNNLLNETFPSFSSRQYLLLISSSTFVRKSEFSAFNFSISSMYTTSLSFISHIFLAIRKRTMSGSSPEPFTCTLPTLA